MTLCSFCVALHRFGDASSCQGPDALLPTALTWIRWHKKHTRMSARFCQETGLALLKQGMAALPLLQVGVSPLETPRVMPRAVAARAAAKKRRGKAGKVAKGKAAAVKTPQTDPDLASDDSDVEDDDFEGWEGYKKGGYHPVKVSLDPSVAVVLHSG